MQTLTRKSAPAPLAGKILPKKPSGRFCYSLTRSGAAILTAGADRPSAATVEELLGESLGPGELGRAARRIHSVMEDRNSYQVEHIELALLAYLPVLLSEILDNSPEWARGPSEGRPSAFNRHLKETLKAIR